MSGRSRISSQHERAARVTMALEETCSVTAGAAEIALRAHGFTGERLMKLARKVANDCLTVAGGSLDSRYEDLVSFLVVIGCRYATTFDPARATSTFEAFLAKKMHHRVPDFYRRKSEGFGDRRYGQDDRVDLFDDPDPADHEVDFDRLVDDRRRELWQLAANAAGWALDEWVVITLDHAAKVQLATERVA